MAVNAGGYNMGFFSELDALMQETQALLQKFVDISEQPLIIRQYREFNNELKVVDLDAVSSDTKVIGDNNNEPEF